MAKGSSSKAPTAKALTEKLSKAQATADAKRASANEASARRDLVAAQIEKAGYRVDYDWKTGMQKVVPKSAPRK